MTTQTLTADTTGMFTQEERRLLTALRDRYREERDPHQIGKDCA